MLKDLERDCLANQTQAADVVVVGGGICGLLLGTRLAKRGIHAIILESGQESGGPDPHPLNEVVGIGQSYRGAEAGRWRGLGGTSVQWGGAMLPFLKCDLGPHTAGWPVNWPVSLDEVSPYFNDIERIFALPGGPFEAAETRADSSDSFILRSAKFPLFRMRNLAQVFRAEIRSPGLEIWVNATAVNFELSENGRLAAVIAESPSGKKLTLEAKFVVFAAGAIESTRLMLLLDAQFDDRLFRPGGQLGHYLYDHLSASAATIQPIRPAKVNKMFGLRFGRGGMRDLRIEASPSLREKAKLPGAFAHVITNSDEAHGFVALRAIYRDLQKYSAVRWRDAAAVASDPGWLLKAAWWRFWKRRLLAPPKSQFELVLVTEQMPRRENTIALASGRVDSHGKPLAQISWNVGREDLVAFRSIYAELVKYWRTSDFARIGELQLIPEELVWQRLEQDADIFHPGGTTRMGLNPQSAVVDPDLKTFQISNLFVVSTSVFPSGGGANPTFMLMAFALRAADRIAQEFSETIQTKAGLNS